MLCGWVNVCQLSSSLSATAVSERQISKSVMMHIPERAGIKYFIASDTETSPRLESFSSGHILSDHPSPGEEKRLPGFLQLQGRGLLVAKSLQPGQDKLLLQSRQI